MRERLPKRRLYLSLPSCRWTILLLFLQHLAKKPLVILTMNSHIVGICLLHCVGVMVSCVYIRCRFLCFVYKYGFVLDQKDGYDMWLPKSAPVSVLDWCECECLHSFFSNYLSSSSQCILQEYAAK